MDRVLHLDALLREQVGEFAYGVLRLRHDVTRGSLESLWQRPSTTTLDRLRSFGFSSTMIDRFFRPFLGGIFLDRELSTSSRLFIGTTAIRACAGVTMPPTVWTASCWSPQLGLYCAVSATGVMLSSDGWNWQPVPLAVTLKVALPPALTDCAAG